MAVKEKEEQQQSTQDGILMIEVPVPPATCNALGVVTRGNREFPARG